MYRFSGLRFEAVPEPTPTPGGTSEGNQPVPEGTATGSPGEGAPDGSAAAGSPADAGTTINWEERAKAFQSRADRIEAENRRLQAQLAGGAEGTTATAGGGDEPLTQAGLAAFLNQRDGMNQMLARVQKDYPNAHPEIFRRYLEYGDPDDLFLAAQESHTAETAYRERIRTEEAERARAALAGNGQTGGAGEPPPAGQPTSTGNGQPSVQELAGMSQAQLDAVEKQFPGLIDKVLLGAPQEVTFTG